MPGESSQAADVFLEADRTTHELVPTNMYSLASRRVALECVPKLYLWSMAVTRTLGFTFARSSTIRSACGSALDE
ncbi:hypothetical protein ACFPRL_17440 [Pseudoclavibacter helvolus]